MVYATDRSKAAVLGDSDFLWLCEVFRLESYFAACYHVLSVLFRIVIAITYQQHKMTEVGRLFISVGTSKNRTEVV